MHATIDGKEYDTSKAHRIASWSNGLAYGHCWEDLYALDGYFIHGWGDSASEYASSFGLDRFEGEKIVPLGYDGAKLWLAEKAIWKYDDCFAPPTWEDADIVRSRWTRFHALKSMHFLMDHMDWGRLFDDGVVDFQELAAKGIEGLRERPDRDVRLWELSGDPRQLAWIAEDGGRFDACVSDFSELLRTEAFADSGFIFE